MPELPCRRLGVPVRRRSKKRDHVVDFDVAPGRRIAFVECQRPVGDVDVTPMRRREVVELVCHSRLRGGVP